MAFSSGLGLILDPIKKKNTDDPGAITSNTSNPMAISALSVSASSGSATVTWTTTNASTSRVQYGVAPNMDQTTQESDTSPLVTSHSVSLANLKVGKTYLIRVHSRLQGNRDGQNNTVIDGYDFYADGRFVAA